MRLITGLSSTTRCGKPYRPNQRPLYSRDRQGKALPAHQRRGVGTACAIAVAVCGLCGIGRVEFPHPSAAVTPQNRAINFTEELRCRCQRCQT
jgi:hypothetical protein